MKRYPEYILKKLRQREGLEEDDKSQDDKLNRMTANIVFAECLQWEGFFGYAHIFKDWIKDIYGVDLDNMNG